MWNKLFKNKLGLTYNFTVYFIVFGKKMKTNIHATSEEHAKELLLNKIEFVELEKGEIVKSKFYENYKEIANEYYEDLKSNFEDIKKEILSKYQKK